MELKINEKTAKEIYPGAPEAVKTILVETFGKKIFRKTEYTDFETFDDLCQAIGTTEIEFNKKWDPAEFDPSTIAFEKLKVCTRAYNPDWKFNAYDTNQRKHYPYFEVLSSGFGLSGAGYYYDYADTSVGSRLCFESAEKAAHAGRTFLKLFEDFITAIY